MSNEVYGYLEVSEMADKTELLAKLQDKTGLGVKEIPFSKLYNFPQSILPANENRYLAFIIGDRPDKENTSYLTDYMDYAPEANIGLPIKGKERLFLLIKLFTTMIHEFDSCRFVVAITECSQVEKIKIIKIQDLESVLYDDFELYEAPPDCIYDIMIR